MNKKKQLPKTRLRFKELLAKHRITELAKLMNVPYTQLYLYKREGANPTLLVLEKMAYGLSKLRGETILVTDLLEVAKNKGKSLKSNRATKGAAL